MKNIHILLTAIILTIGYNNSTNSQTFQWAKQFKGAGPISETGSSITVDPSGNVFTTGTFFGTADFDPGADTFNLKITPPGVADAYISKLDAFGNFIWAKQIGGTTWAWGIAITADASGNVYITGNFSGTVDFDPGPGTYNITSLTGQDVFISKLDVFGNFIWVKQLGGDLSVGNRSIVVDILGNVYTTGTFKDTVDFDPGAGTYNLTSKGEKDIFINKLDSFGNFIWAKQFEGSDVSEGGGVSIAVDALGNVYTTGSFYYQIDFDPGAGTYIFTSFAGVFSVFVSKLDATGSFVWAKFFGGSSTNRGYSIAVDNFGNVYTTGTFTGDFYFDPVFANNQIKSEGNNDVYICKLNPLGDFTWAKQLGGPLEEASSSITVDASRNVYTTGGFTGTTDFDPGPGLFNLTSEGGVDVFINKLDVSGNFVWTKQLGGALNDHANAISIDASENIYTTGVFEGIVDFDPGTGNHFLTSAQGGDVFVHKMSQSSTSIDFLENADGSRFTVFPNPTSGNLTIDLENEFKNVNVTVRNITGQVISRSYFSTTQIPTIEIDGPSGFYFIDVQTVDGLSANLKVLKK